ncbi:MAG: F0F1 ATP synthase subunit B [Acetobacteraceae bacterium]|nr:F0F1 ATP synthase subunit B [Acetobacteraceae bacterium]
MFSDTKFWVAAAIVLFFVAFGRILFRAVANLLDARAEKIHGELEEARRLRTEAEAMLADARKGREAAEAEAAALVAHAKEEAARLAAATERELAAMAERRERQAADRIAAAEAEAVAEVRAAAADAAIAAARQVIASQMNTTQQAKLVDDAIASLPGRMRAA